MEQLGKEKLSPVSNDNPLVVKHMDGWMDLKQRHCFYILLIQLVDETGNCYKVIFWYFPGYLLFLYKENMNKNKDFMTVICSQEQQV